MGERTLVIGYDDSADARNALEAAGALCAGWRAIVVHAWGTAPAAVPIGSGMAVVSGDQALDDSELERDARQIADNGADRARHAGLESEADARHAATPEEIAAVLLQAAAEHQAALVVVGRRGLGRVKAAVLGSVSDTLVREAPLPVLVVPSQDASS